MTAAPEAVLDPFGLVAKHGGNSHDQKSHGNRGGGDPVDRAVALLGAPNPATFSSSIVQHWRDRSPEERLELAMKMWRGSFATAASIRAVASGDIPAPAYERDYAVHIAGYVIADAARSAPVRTMYRWDWAAGLTARDVLAVATEERGAREYQFSKMPGKMYTITAPTLMYEDGREGIAWLGESSVAKHGSHNQKDHGNWARGHGIEPLRERFRLPNNWSTMTLDEQETWAESEQNPYRTGTVVGGDVTSGDYRVEVDPQRRFTEFWQRTYEGYGLVREAAMRALDGKHPLGENDGSWTSDSHSVFTMGENGTWVNGSYTYNDLYQDVESAGRWVADGLRNGSTGKVLFRGTNLTQDQIDRLATSGETLELGPSATSTSSKIANRYSLSDLEPREARVVFRFPESTKHLDLTPHSDWGEDHPEAIVAGKFKVTGVFQNRAAVGSMYIAGNPDTEPHYYVNLEPVEQP